MRKCNNGRNAGWIAIAAGIIIILALVLPSGFWWFAAAIALIVGGIKFLHRC